ncbi:unnamed protein product [Nesidiocoris tenuis]|uniref:Uncharacterized protein n=1 Tax=Nesidiocoris tenuis TaxID=355587 RepID=A0A6H5GIJ1_9HEMI|nr:unnamed protein product [Nesidiocoris tenuis]
MGPELSSSLRVPGVRKTISRWNDQEPVDISGSQLTERISKNDAPDDGRTAEGTRVNKTPESTSCHHSHPQNASNTKRHNRQFRKCLLRYLIWFSKVEINKNLRQCRSLLMQITRMRTELITTFWLGEEVDVNRMKGLRAEVARRRRLPNIIDKRRFSKITDNELRDVGVEECFKTPATISDANAQDAGTVTIAIREKISSEGVSVFYFGYLLANKRDQNLLAAQATGGWVRPLSTCYVEVKHRFLCPRVEHFELERKCHRGSGALVQVYPGRNPRPLVTQSIIEISNGRIRIIRPIVLSEPENCRGTAAALFELFELLPIWPAISLRFPTYLRLSTLIASIAILPFTSFPRCFVISKGHCENLGRIKYTPLKEILVRKIMARIRMKTVPSAWGRYCLVSHVRIWLPGLELGIFRNSLVYEAIVKYLRYEWRVMYHRNRGVVILRRGKLSLLQPWKFSSTNFYTGFPYSTAGAGEVFRRGSIIKLLSPTSKEMLEETEMQPPIGRRPHWESMITIKNLVSHVRPFSSPAHGQTNVTSPVKRRGERIGQSATLPTPTIYDGNGTAELSIERSLPCLRTVAFHWRTACTHHTSWNKLNNVTEQEIISGRLRKENEESPVSRWECLSGASSRNFGIHNKKN